MTSPLFLVYSTKKLQPQVFFNDKSFFVTFTYLLVNVLFLCYQIWQRQLVVFAVLSGTFPSTLLSLCCFLLFCSLHLMFAFVLYIHTTVSRVSGGQEVSWNCSCLEKPILWLDRSLHRAAMCRTRGCEARPTGETYVRKDFCCHGDHTRGPKSDLVFQYDLILSRRWISCYVLERVWLETAEKYKTYSVVS